MPASTAAKSFASETLRFTCISNDRNRPGDLITVHVRAAETALAVSSDDDHDEDAVRCVSDVLVHSCDPQSK